MRFFTSEKVILVALTLDLVDSQTFFYNKPNKYFFYFLLLVVDYAAVKKPEFFVNNV